MQNLKPHRESQEGSRHPCIVGCRQVAEVPSLDALIWKMTEVRGQCPSPRSSFMGLSILPISARLGFRGQQGPCQDRFF